jgi:hypothetical protein
MTNGNNTESGTNNSLPGGDSHISRAQEIMARAKVTATAKLTAATK